MPKLVDASYDGSQKNLAKAERDVVALGIAIAAIILFVGTGGSVMPQIMRAWMGIGAAPNLALTNALMLNVALLLFGWRRYKDLRREVSVRRTAEEKARELAEIDPLTGCLNRRSGMPAIAALANQGRKDGRGVAVFMIDFDKFKMINDLNGHSMGDRVLTSCAHRINELLPAGGLLARIGGDEFTCAIAYDLDRPECAEQLAAQIIKDVAAPISFDGMSVEITVSIGISSSGMTNPDNSPANADTLIHRADIAMYHAKNSGRNRHVWFEIQMEDDLRFRNELETGIRKGISAGEFVPYYEQQIDLETGDLVGFEMLARWQSPQFGLVSPEVFIPIAEDIGLISDLSEQLIKRALQDAKEWDQSLTLSVNISPLQLRDPWFSQKILHLLVESGFPASRLEVEITESCLHENVGAVRTIVTSLKNQGIRISLDDFGTGYSSLSQLRSLPFDRLKIDRSFVTEMLRDGGNAELVKAMVSMGKGLALPVTAEGIESPQVLEALKDMGQLKGQGYLYGRPEDAEATRTRLAGLKMLNQSAAVKSDECTEIPEELTQQRKAS